MVNTTKFEWTDTARSRVVPVKIYSKKEKRERVPVIIFSHGLGSSRDVYGYLGRHWASHGFVSVHLQHAGSDVAVWENSPVSQRLELLKRAAANPENWINRPKDVSFVIDQLEKLNANDSHWKDRLDLDCIGVAGHSFGAFTASSSVGELFFPPDGQPISFRDPRIKAAILLSPSVAPKEKLNVAYAGINVPCLHMTGTEDESPLGETKAEERRLPFDHISTAKQYLVNFESGDHFIFSGRWADQSGGENDKMFQQHILSSSTAFWDAFLKNDNDAVQWLNDSFPKELDRVGFFEKNFKNF